MIYVPVIANDPFGEVAMKLLKRKMQRERIFPALKEHRYYESPSESKVRKAKESVKRIKKARRYQG